MVLTTTSCGGLATHNFGNNTNNEWNRHSWEITQGMWRTINHLDFRFTSLNNEVELQVILISKLGLQSEILVVYSKTLKDSLKKIFYSFYHLILLSKNLNLYYLYYLQKGP